MHRLEAGIELDAILEAAVHPLAVEGHDGVRGIADERRRSAGVCQPSA